MPAPRARLSRRLTLSTAFLALAAGGTAACDTPPPPATPTAPVDGREEASFHCTREDGTVVQEDFCDDDGDGRGGTYFLHGASGSNRYTPGQKVPLGSGPRFPYGDRSQRATYGLPERGPVSNGTVKTGVVGKGGAPAGVNGAGG